MSPPCRDSAPLLYVGEDFARTDVQSALPRNCVELTPRLEHARTGASSLRNVPFSPRRLRLWTGGVQVNRASLLRSARLPKDGPAISPACPVAPRRFSRHACGLSGAHQRERASCGHPRAPGAGICRQSICANRGPVPASPSRLRGRAHRAGNTAQPFDRSHPRR
jgi:hypothetical protein